MMRGQGPLYLPFFMVPSRFYTCKLVLFHMHAPHAHQYFSNFSHKMDFIYSIIFIYCIKLKILYYIKKKFYFYFKTIIKIKQKAKYTSNLLNLNSCLKKMRKLVKWVFFFLSFFNNKNLSSNKKVIHFFFSE